MESGDRCTVVKVNDRDVHNMWYYVIDFTLEFFILLLLVNDVHTSATLSSMLLGQHL